jgi:prolyl-tRNA editing enzyme YbaK/EbsC (Cys-tRNA(Pro) deacylase)
MAESTEVLGITEQLCLARFTAFVQRHGLAVDIIDCGSDTLTVSQAASATGASPQHIVKTLLFHDGDQGRVIAIASGLSRVDPDRLSAASGLGRVRLARPQQVLETLGYPAGGVPPLDLPPGIPVIMDSTAAALDLCYAGAGTTRHLARLDPRVIRALNDAAVARITEDSPNGRVRHSTSSAG